MEKQRKKNSFSRGKEMFVKRGEGIYARENWKVVNPANEGVVKTSKSTNHHPPGPISFFWGIPDILTTTTGLQPGIRSIRRAEIHQKPKKGKVGIKKNKRITKISQIPVINFLLKEFAPFVLWMSRVLFTDKQNISHSSSLAYIL